MTGDPTSRKTIDAETYNPSQGSSRAYGNMRRWTSIGGGGVHTDKVRNMSVGATEIGFANDANEYPQNMHIVTPVRSHKQTLHEMHCFHLYRRQGQHTSESR